MSHKVFETNWSKKHDKIILLIINLIGFVILPKNWTTG